MDFELESMWDAMKVTHYQRIINELRNSLSQAADLDQALTIALNKVAISIHAEAATFWFYDKFGDGRIRPRAVYGGKDLGDFSLAFGEGVAGHVIEAGQSVIICDCQKSPIWAGKIDASTGFQTLSMLCVPLPQGRHVFGCIQIINKTDHTFFDDKDLIFAENLAEHIAHLFEEQLLLAGYHAPLPTAETIRATKTEPTFTQLFSAERFRQVEESLRDMEIFSHLSDMRQKNVLRHCREVWMILDNNRPAPEKSKRKFFGS